MMIGLAGSARGRVGVIGGGLGGLAAACTLAARGFSVLVLERNSWLGGKAAVLAERGFRFDMGPTILTMPRTISRISTKPAGAWKTIWNWCGSTRSGDRSSTTARHSICSRTLTPCPLVSMRSPRKQVRTIGDFMEHSARLHRISDRYFFGRPVGGLRDIVNVKTAVKPSLLGDLVAIRPGSSLAGTVRSHVNDSRVAQMLDHFGQYVGSAPDASPAILCGIAHMQTAEGVWYPLGGTGAVPRALVQLATELGVEIRTGTGVRRIVLAGQGRVRGVETESGERIPFDGVVCNADAVRTHRELVRGEPASASKRRRRYEPACSGVVLYLGLDRRYEHLLHHNFVFSRDPDEEFDAIYRRGEPAPDPTCYVCARRALRPVSRRPAAMRCMCSPTHPTFAHITTGIVFCPPIARRFSQS